MTRKKEACLSVILISLVTTVTIVTITGSGIFGVAHGQGSNSTTSSSLSSLTPQQKAAICDPNNPKLNFVNTTESKLCGIPKTVKSNMSNTTTTPAAPSVAPTSGS